MKKRDIVIVLMLLMTVLWASPKKAIHSRKYMNLPTAEIKEPSRADSLTGFDVQKYTITLEITQDPNHIEGSVLAEVIATEPLSQITYELEHLTVSEVKVDGDITGYTHENGLLNIPVSAAIGESFETEVFYGGTPQLSGSPYNVGMYMRPNSIFTVSDPDAARFWWPCYDHPWDKAVVDLIITMRSDWKVAANGLRESITDNGDGTSTTIWRGEHPMTTYLVCITAGDYVEIPQTALNGELPIMNFVSPHQEQSAIYDLGRLPEMIEYYSGLFGLYPFEKYGNATVNMSTFGAMEHQTMTTLGNYIIDGVRGHELTVAHELVHQWFGNAVSFLDFYDVWLSEAFATYGEMLWVDHTEGWEAACDYVRSSYHAYYMSWENENNPPTIYDPPFNQYFYPQSYEKAASVLHMLRLKFGDDMFFELLQTYFEEYKHGNAVTAEFQAIAEDIYGESLDQFFRQWIFGKGIPRAEYSVWHHPDSSILKINARTTSTSATDFTVDIPFLIQTAAGSDSLLVVASPTGEVNLFEGMNAPLDYSANHNNWTLLRGLTGSSISLERAIPMRDSAMLVWQEMPEAVNYLIHFKKDGDDDWTEIYAAHSPLTIENLDSGEEYFFKICPVDNEDYFGMPSEIKSCIPVPFTLNQNLLVVDETRDGAGTPFSPDNDQIDSFYRGVLGEYHGDEWDVDTQGLPELSDLASYRMVLWHDDDFSQNQGHLAENTLTAYVQGGGHLIFSGWGSSTYFSDFFFESASGSEIEIYFDNSPCLSEVIPLEMPALEVDTDKLAPIWQDMLPKITTFEGDFETLYIAGMDESFVGADRPLAFRSNHGRLAFMGFPMYFMKAEGISQLLESLISPHWVGCEDDVCPPLAAQLSCYPNPFNPSATISFDLPKDAEIQLSLYNLKGQRIKELFKGRKPRGSHNFELDGNGLSSGIYLIRLKGDKLNLMRKISMIK
ncbi:MAG TPA: T9SS type A sorting domain-containing protein [Candidatus Cloacimonetes bacterium]|nr:T9SS type A sorting domain-containing protein [Candidatus Cloacimonadota bacterium]